MLFLLKTLFVIDALVLVALALFRAALAPCHRSIVSGKVAALALLTPAVALFCGNVYVFYAYLAVVVAFNSRSRAELAATYVFLLPLLPPLTLETGARDFYLLAMSSALAMGFGALVGFAVTTNRRSLAQPRHDLAALALVGIFLFIYNRDPSFTGVLRTLTLYGISFLGPYLLLSRSLSRPEDVERVLLRLALGATVMAVVALFQSVKHWVVFETFYSTLRVPFPITSFTLAMRAGLLRTGGTMLDFSSGGLFLACAVTLFSFLRRYFRPLGYWAVLAVLIGGLVVTQSRGAWAAAASGVLFGFAFRGQWSRAVLMVGAAAAAQAAIFASSGRLAAIAGRTADASGTVDYRRRLLSRGLEQVRAHPLLGQTQERLVANLPDLRQGEHIVDFVNSHLFVAMAAGIPLFLVWCAVWLSPVAQSWRARARLAAEPFPAGAPAAMIASALVALTFTSVIDRNLTWPTIALGMAGPCLALARRRAPQAQARTRLVGGARYAAGAA